MLKTRIKYLVLILFFFALYTFNLDRVPVHLNQDELMFALNAESIAEKGTDFYGSAFPFYFWHLDSLWATPIIVYLTAIFLKFLPLSETTIRLSSVFVGGLAVTLIALLVQKIFKNKFVTLASGFLAAMTPVLFIHSRLLLDNIYPVLFVLLWLLFLYSYIEKKSPLMALLSGLSLGIGLHSYHAAKVVMPVYFLLTFPIFVYEAKKDLRSLGFFVLGFLIPIILFIPWLNRHPDTLLNQVSYIGSVDKSVKVQKGIMGVFNLTRAGSILSSYFTYFSPEILFFRGDASLIHSTHEAGVFLFPLVFLLVFGILEVVFRRKDFFSKLILAGFLLYPLAPSLVNDPQRISRGLVVIPFVLILSSYGFSHLLSFKQKSMRVLVSAILVFSVLQFIVFVKDYFGNYRKISATMFNNDIGGALESVIKSTKVRKVERVYIDRQTLFIDKYFRFYQIKFGTDLEEITSFFEYTKEDFSLFPKYSLVMIRADHVVGREDWAGNFQKIEIIREPNGNEAFYIYYRDR